MLRVLEMAAAGQLRITTRQRLAALCRDLGRRREADAHLRSLAAKSPSQTRIPAAQAIANGQPHAALAP